MITGSSPGAWGTTANMVKALNLAPHNIVRCFSPSDAAGVTAGFAIAYSNDSGHNRGADLVNMKQGDSAWNSWLTELTRVFARDDAAGYLIVDHEFDIHSNDYPAEAHKYAQLNLLRNQLNKGRTHKIQTAVVTTGMVYDSQAYKQLTQIPANVIGVDNYARKHWDTCGAFAKSIKKPCGAFENGIQAQTDPNKYTDAQVSAAMTQDFASAKKAGFAVFCYWPNGGNDLTKRPLSTKNLAAFCAANR
jgi:hypothetical protein